MSLLHQSAFFEALGWTLVESLWQTGLVWVMYVLITNNGKHFSAAKRYLLASAGIAIATICFLASFVSSYVLLLQGSSLALMPISVSRYLFGDVSTTTVLQSFVPFLSMIYMCLLVFFCTRFTFGFFKSKQLLQRGLLPADDVTTHACERLASTLGINKKVKLWLSQHTDSALTLGFWKPVILLPVAAMNKLSIAQVEAVIAHELFHIRRNDYIINILITLSELLLFFNPFARTLQLIIRKERENSCDDKVMSMGYNPWEYAESLYLLSSSTLERNQFAMCIAGNNSQMLLNRVKRMLTNTPARVSLKKPLAIFATCIIASLFTGMNDVRTVADPKSSTAPLVVRKVAHPEQAPIIIFSSRIEKTEPRSAKHRHIISITYIKIVKTAPTKEQDANQPELNEEPADEQTISDEQTPDLIHHVMLRVKEPEFTIIESKPVVPLVNAAKPLPYVPATTFYFPDVKDTLPTKKMVNI